MGLTLAGTGAYHIEGPIFTGNANYTITSELAAINGKPPETTITDDFSLRTVT